MRLHRPLALLSVGTLVGVLACIGSSHDPNLVVSDDAGDADDGDDGDAPEGSDDTGVSQETGISQACTLSDGSDPVAICVQEKVFESELQHAYTKGQGVAPSWSSVVPYAAGTGHLALDDLGLAGALGAYHCSSAVYGNNYSTAAFDAVLVDLSSVLVPELTATPPSGYDGETYFRLRWAQAGFLYVDSTVAATVQGIADTYGEGLAGQVHAVPASGSSPGGVVIGTLGGDGTVTYAPVQTMMAAAALYDMAVQHWSDPDAGAEPQQWMTAAAEVIAYVEARGRDPKTGLYYQSLVTSGDAGHDQLGTAQPSSDTELGDDQAWIVLALARAEDLLVQLQAEPGDGGADGGVFDASASITQPYWNEANALVAAMTTAGLFDGTSTPMTPPAAGAFMQSFTASTGQIVTDKTTVENAILFGAFVRANGLASPLAYEIGELRTAVIQTSPPASSLLSVVADGTQAVQQAYLGAASKSYGYAVTFSDAGPGAVEPDAAQYQTESVIAAIEGLSELWYGSSTHAAPCAP